MTIEEALKRYELDASMQAAAKDDVHALLTLKEASWAERRRVRTLKSSNLKWVSAMVRSRRLGQQSATKIMQRSARLNHKVLLQR